MASITATIKKLHSFRELEDGWRFGKGGPPDEAIIEKVEGYVRKAFALNIVNFDVFTGAEREVLLGLYSPNRDLEITFEADGSITLAEDRNNEQVDFIENATESELFKRIWMFQFQEDTLYVPSIRETLTPKKELLTALRLNRQAMEAESQSSTATAPSKLAEQSVTTLDDSTPPSPNTQESTGLFPLTMSQATA